MSREPEMFTEEDDPSYVSLLPHLAVEPKDGLVLLGANAEGIPDAMGLAWRLVAPEMEALSDAAAGTYAHHLDAFLKNLPDGSCSQFILRSARDLGRRFASWESSTVASDPILAEFASQRRSALERLSVPGNGSAFEARSMEVLWTFTRRGSWLDATVDLFDAIACATGRERAAAAQIDAATARDRKGLLETARTLESLLAQANVRFSRLGREEIAEELWKALNPLRSRTLPVPAEALGDCIHEDPPLRERVARSGLAADLDRGHVVLDDRYIKVVSVARFPSPTRAGVLMRTLGAATLVDAASEMDLVLNVHIPDQEEIRGRWSARRRLAQNQARDLHQNPTMQPQAEKLAEVEQELSAGERMAWLRMHAVVRGRSADEADERARAVSAAFQMAGFHAVIEEALAASLFLQSVPFGYRPESDRLFRRGRHIHTANLAHLLPLYASFQGTRQPALLLLNRRGEPVTLNFFEDNGAPHALIAGQTGSGKSVMANEIVRTALRRGGHVWIIDRGGSYKVATEMLGGAYVALDAMKPPRINPCGRSGADGSCPDEAQSFLRDWLSEMVTRGHGPLASRDQGLLSEAVRAAFKEHPGEEIRLTQIRESLRRLAGEYPTADDLALALGDFVVPGPYARFFDGPNEADFERRLVTVDLADAALEDTVRSPLVMALMHQITTAARRWLGEEKYLLIDEAWTLLKSPAASAFVENCARTARKHRLSLTVISQQVTDLEGPAAKAILAQTRYRLLFREETDAILLAARLLGMPRREVELYQSLRSADRTYSEALIKTPTSTGVARLVLGPLEYWLSTSDPKDRQYLARLVARRRENGHDEREALRLALLEAALRNPQGIGTAGEMRIVTDRKDQIHS